MQNVLGTEMNTGPRQPSRLPVRGTIGLVGTVGAMALLLSFRGAPTIGGVVGSNVGQAEATDELINGAATESNAADITATPVTLTGDLIETRWGEVQVTVVLDGSDITDVRSLSLPAGDSRSAEISDYVGSVLREEAITSDSADVSVISGATYTSEAYASSLQSALDQAGDDMIPAREGGAVPADKLGEPATEVAASEPVTATGDAVAIRWGEVQVAVTVEGDDIVQVETLSIPDGDRKSRRISGYVEPVLREEAIAIDSADVSVVSGATYTSQAYAASLQSALDQLGV